MDVLEMKEREFAQQLKQCTGSEELDLILNYINWLEVNCPQKVSDVEVITILSNTLTKFNEVQYTNDTRYIGLLVKYMQSQTNALELFQLAFTEGKGVECAVLYCAWADCLTRMNDCNGANQVYQLAIQKNAKPAEQLQLSYLLFQVNVGRSCLSMDKLTAFDRDVIDAFMTLQPQRVTSQLQPISATAHTSQSNGEGSAVAVAIFEPETPTKVCCYPKKEIYAIKNHEFQYEEILAIRHEKKLQNRAVVQNVEQNGAATVSEKDDKEFTCPVAYFEPDNPNVVRCYPFKEIYAIKNHEFQYEEILALRHEKKLQNRAVVQNVEQNRAATVSEKDDKEFTCPVAYFEPDNPNVVRCYPFKEVYAIENHEFQLEEVYAARYEKKLQEMMENKHKEKRKSRQTLHPNELADLTKDLQEDDHQEEAMCLTIDNDGKQTLQQPLKLEKHGNDSASIECSRNSQNAELTPHSMGSAPRTACDQPATSSSHINQSVTSEVMHMVQDMWKSPSPVAGKLQPPPLASIRKNVHPSTKTPFKLYTDQMEVDGTPAAANKENASAPRTESSAVRKSLLHPTTKTPFKLYTDQMDVDGTPRASKENAALMKGGGGDCQQPVKQGFPSSRFQSNQFVANDWTKNQQMDENAQSMASAVRPSSENTSASNMNQSVTREVMDIIQGMWKDSTPSPVRGRPVQHPQSVLIGKGIPIFTDEPDRPGLAAATTAKRLAPAQPQPLAASRASFAAASRQSLQFSAAASAAAAATHDLKENHCPGVQNFRVPPPSVAAPRGGPLRMGLGLGQDDIEMLPDSDFCDTTCNTRAFQFALPSSTPLITHSMRDHSLPNRDNNNCSMLLADGSHKPNTDLSIIIEASKEKSSSSSGSSSGVRTPYTINKKRNPAEDIKEETEQQSQLEKLVSQMTIDENLDPFCPTFVSNLLASINFPQKHHAAYMVGIDRDAPLLPHNATVTLGTKEYRIESQLGEGSYARVLRATTNNANKKMVGLKIQKPAFAWEYYIAKEVQTRLKNAPILQGFMSIDCAFIYRNASILEMDFAPYGNLLDAINKVKAASGKQIHVSIATLLSIQLFDIVDHLHKCKIIHGDIKPDNFVLFSIPTSNPLDVCIKLIDFGRSIDMSLLPDGIEFRRVVKTEDFQCTEMRDGRPWTYQTDLFGLAGTTYLLLMGEYMKVTKKGNEWALQKNIHRYLHREVWVPIYEELLNVHSCSQLPNLSEIRKRLQALLASMDQKWLSHCLMSFGNILQGH